MAQYSQPEHQRPVSDPGKRTASVAELVPELGTDLVRLMQSEADLLRAEIGEKIEKVETGLASMAAGGVCLIAGLVILLQALVVALANSGMDAGWAALIVGALGLVVGVALLTYGKRSAQNLTPERSVNEIRRSTKMAKEKVQ